MMRNKRPVLSFIICTAAVLFAFKPDAVWAAKSCYTQSEAEAEQAIRIHSELMVIGLNCQHMRFSDGTNLYLEYREFTNTHERLFSFYEEQLVNYFKRQGVDSEAAINTLRTQFANKISLDAARMKPDQFCNRYASRILKVSDFKTNDIKRWAATFYPSHPVSRPLCTY